MSRSPYAANPGDLFNPPAIVQPEESFSAVMRQAGAINAEIVRDDKLNIQRALQLGRMLNRARPMAAHGEWEPALEGQRISKQRASEFMRGAEAPPEVQAEWQSISDMRRWLSENARKNDETSTGGRLAQDEPEPTPAPSSNPAAGLLKPPVQPGKRCPSCQRKGYRIGCEECKQLNGGKVKTERQPGEEDEPAQAVSLRKKIDNACGSFRNQLNDVARTYGVPYKDGRAGRPASFEHPLLQKAFDLYLEAKTTALRAEWELRKRSEADGLPE
jgi:hypothetical protein